MIKVFRDIKAFLIKATKDNTYLLHLIFATYIVQILFVILFPIIEWYGLISSLIIVMGIEVFNECVVDKKFDWSDFWWTLIGVLIGLIYILLIKLT